MGDLFFQACAAAGRSDFPFSVVVVVACFLVSSPLTHPHHCHIFPFALLSMICFFFFNANETQKGNRALVGIGRIPGKLWSCVLMLSHGGVGHALKTLQSCEGKWSPPPALNGGLGRWLTAGSKQAAPIWTSQAERGRLLCTTSLLHFQITSFLWACVYPQGGLGWPKWHPGQRGNVAFVTAAVLLANQQPVLLAEKMQQCMNII